MTIILFLDKQSDFNLSNNIFIYTMIFMFIFTLIYLCLDFYYGFTIKSIIKDCEDISTIKELSLENRLFLETLKKFELSNVSFLLQKSEEVNAFAVLSLRKKYVIITTSMIEHISKSFDTQEAKEKALQGLIAHELSHLLNWDSLPNLILLSGQFIAVMISSLLTLISTVVIKIVSIIPIVSFLATGVTYIFLFLQFALGLIYGFILHPLYLLVERFLGRVIEHRSDYQSAKAMSWEPMYLCLSALLNLQGNTFNSNFSTHPSTISRILHIYKVEKSSENIEVSFFSKYFSLIIVFASLVLTIYFLVINFNQLNYLNEKIISYFHQMKDFIFYIHETNLYLPIVIYFIGTVLMIYLYKKLSLTIKKFSVSKNLNKSVNTEIDFLLLYAIENNNLNEFLDILKSGANIKVTFSGRKIEEFAQEVNPKFLKHIEKIKS